MGAGSETRQELVDRYLARTFAPFKARNAVSKDSLTIILHSIASSLQRQPCQRLDGTCGSAILTELQADGMSGSKDDLKEHIVRGVRSLGIPAEWEGGLALVVRLRLALRSPTTALYRPAFRYVPTDCASLIQAFVGDQRWVRCKVAALSAASTGWNAYSVRTSDIPLSVRRALLCDWAVTEFRFSDGSRTQTRITGKWTHIRSDAVLTFVRLMRAIRASHGTRPVQARPCIFQGLGSVLL